MAPAAARRLLAAFDRLAAAAPAGLTAFAVGRRSLELALDASSLEIERVYFPLLGALALLLLAAAFREASAVLLPLAYVAACELALLGAMGRAGVRFNLILAMLPPLLFVIGLATALFLLIRCRALEAEGLDAGAATVATLRRAEAGARRHHAHHRGRLRRARRHAGRPGRDARPLGGRRHADPARRRLHAAARAARHGRRPPRRAARARLRGPLRALRARGSRRARGAGAAPC